MDGFGHPFLSENDLMLNFLFKKVIVVEYEDRISIYDTFEKVTNNDALLPYVNKNLTLKNGLISINADLHTGAEYYYPVTIYAAHRFNFLHLSDAASCAYHQFKSILTRSSCDWDGFSAYSFKK
jgi:hypothetical protein